MQASREAILPLPNLLLKLQIGLSIPSLFLELELSTIFICGFSLMCTVKQSNNVES